MGKLFGTDLKIVGGAGDNGIDLIGTTQLPPDQKPSTLIVQCKLKHNPSKSISSGIVRETVGASSPFPKDTIVVLASNAPLSESGHRTFLHSTHRSVFVQLDHRDIIDNPIRSIEVNYRFRLMHPNIHIVKVRRFKGLMDYMTFHYQKQQQ